MVYSEESESQCVTRVTDNNRVVKIVTYSVSENLKFEYKKI